MLNHLWKLRGRIEGDDVNISRALFFVMPPYPHHHWKLWDETHIFTRALQFIGVEMLLDHCFSPI